MPRTNPERFRTESVESSKTSSETEAETDSKNAVEHETCPECGGPLRSDASHGETACAECGLVVDEDEIDHGAEWSAFSAKEREQKSRVGAPTTEMMHDKGLSTNIGWADRDAYGNSLSNRKKRQMNRLRTWNERFRTEDARDRNLKHALGEISRMASALGVPESVRETAGVIYRRALEENLLPGRSVEGVASAALYAATRQASIPRSLDEIGNVSRVETVAIMRTYRYVSRELNLTIPPSDPTDYVPRFASKLGAPEEVERAARDILEEAIDAGYPSGKSPVGLAAAALYAGSLITNNNLTQKEIGEAANISKVTIRNRYRDLLEISGAHTPPK
ncbi:transcription initiation factor IIB [Halococcus thailandensis]|nr:TFIIB-type zinc ribbon-containing protein [Halococcus thailandensis]